jgi:phage shock protein A
MAKRRTIGENPLDAVGAGTSLDIVVPDPKAGARARAEAEIKESLAQAVKESQARMEALIQETKEALGRLEAESAGLKEEVARLKAELAQLQAKARPTDLPFWMRGFGR